MSGYRNYVPWNKSPATSSASLSGTNKKEPTQCSKYGSPSYNRTRNDTDKKTEEEKSATSRIASKYGYERDSSAVRDTGNFSGRSTSSSTTSSRNKLEKKDVSHPPVSYRQINRTGARSRDPSPIDKAEKSSTSYDLNKLYPRSYSRSVSRERSDSISSTTTIPKYVGRTSITREDNIPKYSGRSSITREDNIPLYSGRSSVNRDDLVSKYSTKPTTSTKDDAASKYTGRSSVSRDDISPLQAKYSGRSSTSKDEIPKYIGRSSISKDEPTSRYKVASRTTSREDLSSSSSQKYINSRFLPKNSVEKSYTAYTRPSSLRTSETSRKNRELLNVLHAQQEQERSSRPPSRCSSITQEEISLRDRYSSESKSGSLYDEVEMETVTVVTRGTSPTPSSNQSNNFLRSRRVDIAKVVEKTIVRPKKKPNVIDKEVQSDRLDDTSKTSRFANSSRISATPWSTFLDMKYSTPNIKQKMTKSESSDNSNSKNLTKDKNDVKGNCDSPKSISRASSTKSLNQSTSKSDLKGNEHQKSPSPSSSLKSKSNSPKQSQSYGKKQLPPPIPKSDSKPNTLHSLNTPNKDFRKSVLNMNPDNKTKKNLGRRSNSVSSAESDAADPEATDVSENLTSCKSYHNSNSASKLPQKIPSDANVQRSRRSPSSDASTSSSTTAASSSEEDIRSKSSKTKKGVSAGSSRTSMILTDADELSLDKSPKPPVSPKQNTKAEGEAKSFLMRALAPVTNLFKLKHQDSVEKVNWMASSENNSDNSKKISQKESTFESKPAKIILSRIESGERAWWLDENAETNKGDKQQLLCQVNHSNNLQKPIIKHVESGEIAWWLDPNAEIPEGVKTYPNYIREDGTTEDGRIIYKIRNNESDESSWWVDSTSKTSSDASKMQQSNIMDDEYLEKHKIRHIDSGERSWWISSSENIAEMVQAKEDVKNVKPKFAIRHQDSGEKPWWLKQKSKDEPTDVDNESDNGIPLGDRASPEGLEMPKEDEGRLSPYDNVLSQEKIKTKRKTHLFISKHTNIDDILGGTTQLWSPLMDKIFGYDDNKRDECRKYEVGQAIIHDSTAQRGIIQPNRIDTIGGPSTPVSLERKLDDAALQLYKDGDYGSYLDLEASISEQQEEFEGFQSNKKNSIVLRTQLSVRVHTIIEKLLTSEGRELRRALFSLKQIFQEDKDLVHEFVQNDGLSCLIKVGSEADQNYQNYILRALGQVMLYVDGMNGVMEHNQTVQWLYSLISSKFRLVVKTALKLLLVFVEYIDSNCMLLIQAIHTVDYSQGLLPYHNIMKLLKDFDSADTELLIYATTLINKLLNGVPDQDTYYDQTDALEEQGIETIIQRYMSKPGTDLDLLQQFQIYEAVLQYEDGEEINSTPIRHLDESIRKTLRNRKSVSDSTERRKSRRHSTGNTPIYGGLNIRNNNCNNNNLILQTNKEDDNESSSSQSSEVNNSQLNGCYKDSNKGNYTNTLQQRIGNGNILNRNSSRKDLTPLLNAVNKLESEESLTKQPWILSMIQNQENLEDSENANDNDRNLLLQLKRENTVKDLTQKLANQNILHSPSDDNKVNRIGDMTGLISKAKEGLAKSKSKADVVKSPTSENVPKIELKKSENELRWEELVSNLDRPLNLCDMDFTDLATDDETDILAPAAVVNGIPPPPPPLRDIGPAPPPPPLSNRIPPPVPSPPVFGVNLQHRSNNKPIETKIPIKKNKKTVKLFWKEVRDDPISTIKLKSGFIWDELSPVNVDTQKLEHLFESRAKDLITKKQQEMNKNKEIIVLDPKRSNAINIGMTKLPPPRSIKTAILKMDATIMNREGIEKLLTMLPTEEERTKIQEAQAANPDLPLGSAEQFLLTLASVSELPARLKLWAFKLDFENSEREIAEPLMDLKQGFEVLKVNKTFRGILSTLLSIGNFLNGNEVKGFQIEYLAKVPEVKDTVHKHSLLHHLCHIVMEKFPDATDLYSEIGAITRASKIDFDELGLNIQRLEADCKASWDHLKLIAKHDGSTMMKVKMSDFLSDCAERIILLTIIHRRIMNRFHKFLLWLGIPLHQISDTKPNEFCRIVSEFSLEYRTTRERVLQQLEKKANHRERNKTRGKMITDIGKFRTKEDRADAELRQLLGSDISDVESMQGTLPWRRTRRDTNRSFLSAANGNLTDGDDEILESLVKTATKGPSRTAPRERKRTRHADRKSLKRSRTRENNPFGSRDSP